jgi:hypothetical protein
LLGCHLVEQPDSLGANRPDAVPGHSGIRTNDGSKPIRGQRMPGAGLN